MGTRRLTALAAAVAVCCTLSSAASAAIITQLFAPGEFTSAITYTNDFEAGINTPQFSFDSDVHLNSAANTTSGVTSSGSQVLVRTTGVGSQEPLNAYLSLDAFEVGLYFGNGISYTGLVQLSIFDASDTLLGGVALNADGNDFVDQFIGLRSDTAFRRVSLDYIESTTLARVIDDFTIGTEESVAVPEPAPLAALGLGLTALALARRRRA